MTMSDKQPGDKCPVCNAAVRYRFIDPHSPLQANAYDTIDYKCNAHWKRGIGYLTACPKAMQVAIAARTAPTPTTTPAAAARDALVAACVAEENAILDLAAYNGKELADLYALRDARNAASTARIIAVRNYIALGAQEQPQ